MKIALLVGHTEKNQGAIGYNSLSEYEYNKEVAALVSAKCKKEIGIFYRDGIGREGAAKNLGEWGAEVSIELHCNSFNGEVSGCEVLYFKEDEMSKRLGKLFCMRYCETFNSKDRGVVEVKDKLDRRFKNFCYIDNTGVKMKILVEPFFCDNQDDYKNPSVYAGFLISFINML